MKLKNIKEDHRRTMISEFSVLLNNYDIFKEKEFEIKHEDLLNHIGELSTEIYKCHNEINELFELNEEKARRINSAINILEKDENKEPIEVILNNVGKALDILKGCDNND